MLRSAFAAATIASLLLGGCANNQEGGTAIGAIMGGVIGNQFGKGSGKVAATLAGAVVGGIVGNDIGRKLDQRDRELARQAEYDAWERGPPRQPVHWRNPDNGPVRRDHRRGLLLSRSLAMPRLRAPRLDRRSSAGHARYGLPQSRRHLDPGRLKGRRCHKHRLAHHGICGHRSGR
jgi:Glycine zipper 2TM domain